MTASKLRLYHRLQIAAHRAQKAADRAVMGAAGVTTAQAAVLAVVASRQELSQRDVAMQLGVNESAVTAMAARLVAMGLLMRNRDRTDARAWRLALSDAGRAAMKRIERPFGTVNAAFETVLTAKEIAQLADYLARIGAAFEAD